MHSFEEVVTLHKNVTKAASNLSKTQHKQKFLNKYAVQLEMPASYVFCTKFCRKDTNIIAMAVKETFPNDLEFYDIAQLNYTENFTDDMYKRLAMEESESIVFKILELNDGQYKWMNQRQTNPSEYQKSIVAMFSDDGERIGLVRTCCEKQKSDPLGKEIETIHHVIDIFDCSTREFWDDKSLISKDDKFHIFSIYDPQFSEYLQTSVVQIRFSENSKFLNVLINKTCLKVYELKQPAGTESKVITQPVFEFKNPQIFDYIMKVAILEDDIMHSLVAFKRKATSCIDVVCFEWIEEYEKIDRASPGKITKSKIQQLNEKHGTKILTIMAQKCENPITMFSKNLQYLIHYSNRNTYLLNLGDPNESFKQRLLKHLEGKHARYIIPNGEDDFTIATSPPLSQKIAIRLAQDSTQKCKLMTKYVQETMKIHDMILLGNESGCMRLILSRNEEEFRIFDLSTRTHEYHFNRFQLFSHYSFEWPYICYLKDSNEIIVQNAFSVKIAFYLRLNLEESGNHVSHLFLSKDYVLYYAISDCKGYELFSQELKQLQPLIVRTGTTGDSKKMIGGLTSRFAKQLLCGNIKIPLCKISLGDTKSQCIYKFYIRDQGRERLKINQERIILVRVDYKLYHWTNSGDMKFVDDCHRFREITNDISLYLNPKTKTRKTNQIKVLRFAYSDYSTSLLYEEVEGVVVDFLVGDWIVILLIKGQTEYKDARLLKVLEFDSKWRAKVKCTITVEDKDFIRSFLSTEASANSFVCQQNRAYFVITSLSRPVIHKYQNVIPLEDGERILSSSPIANTTYKKMMYCKANYKKFTTKKCIIIPFLNDNHITFNTKQIDIQYNHFLEYRDSLNPALKKQVILTVYPSLQKAFLYNMKGQLKEKVKLDQIYRVLGEDILCVSPNAHIFAHLHNDGIEYEIISLLRITVKCKQVEREDSYVQQFSMNMRNPTNIVRPGKTIVGEKKNKNQPYISVLPVENIEMDKVPLHEENFLAMKKKNAFDIIQHYQSKMCEVKVKMNDQLDLAVGFQYTRNPGYNFGSSQTQSYLKDLMILKVLGKSREAFFVRITSEIPEEQEEQEEDVDRHSLREKLLLKLTKKQTNIEDQIFHRQQFLLDCCDYLLLTDYIIVWSKSCIYYADISFVNSNTSTITLKKVRFEIPNSKLSGEKARIVNVQSQGPTEQDCASKRIFIMIKISLESQSSFVKYDLLKEMECTIHECSPKAQCFFNSEREMYIIDSNFIQCTGSGIPQYQYKVNLDEFECTKNFQEQFEKGFRFCRSSNNTKFMIRRKFYLPYTYHMLILMDGEDEVELSEDNYDPSIVFKYNGDTALHMYASSFQQLNFILEQYQKTNPDLTNMLLMKNNEGKTVLKLAIEQQNAKCVNLILSKIAELSVNNIHSVKDDIDKLMTYDGFEGYLSLCYLKTNQMAHKKALKMVEFDQACPVRIHSARTSYLDQEFYDKFCSEESNDEVASRAININAIDAEWILKEYTGRKFLMALAETDNIRYFDIYMIRIIILFLWQKMKPLIQVFLFIPFLINFGLFNYFTLFTFEQSRIIYDPEKYPNVEEEAFNRWMKSQDILNLIIMGILFLFSLFTMTIEFKQLMFHREKYFTSFWNALDCIAALLVPTILILVFMEWADDSQIRPLNAVTLLIFYLRFFYFLRVFDASAHYVRIIVEISVDIKIFMLVLFMGIAGFAFAFYILSMNNSPNDQFIDSLAGSILYSYLLAVGEFNLDMYSVSTNELLLWVLFSLASLFTLIMLLNMLIAIMGESYSRVSEQAECEKFRDRLQLILENDFLFRNKPKLFKDVKYLIAIEQDRDTFKKSAFNKQLEKLRRTQTAEFKENKALILDMFKHFDVQFQTLLKNIEEKFPNQENSVN